MMDLWACARPQTILEGAKTPGWFSMMRAAHIKGFMVLSYNVSFPIPLEDLARVWRLLTEEGFEMISLAVPLGHPEGLDTPCHTAHEGWHIRRDINGALVRWCNAITPAFTRDMIARVAELRDLGIKTVFWDDDLRQGNHQGDVQGCFCDACIAEFAENYRHVIPRGFSRETLRPVIPRDPAGLNEDQLRLREAWMDFHCARVTGFLEQTNLDGMENGLMVMHRGDRRHGIDLPAIRQRLPRFLFRVGEHVFNDKAFDQKEKRVDLVESILTHLALMGDPDRIFSESTVYPHGALSPENLKRKILLERKCGLRHINLMGVERMNSPLYYQMLRDNYSLFEETEKEFTLGRPIAVE